MKFGIIEGFQMHHSNTWYGLRWDGSRVNLIQKTKKLGFQGVELGIGLDYMRDSLWKNNKVRQAVKEESNSAGIEVPSICLHMLNYIENSLISENPKHRKTSLEIILNTIDICTDIGASLVLVPFFGTASITTKKQIQILTMEMQKLANPAEEKGVHLGLETGLEASTMVQLVESIGSDHVGVYFDTGNTASKGYNMKHEISTLSENILQVHIKDYPYRKLGEGNINFHDVISSLKKISFDGYLILETPSLDDSSKTAIENLEFLKQTLAGVD